jgi:cellulose synthase/poly-beta-1,6-N-acetylglucosamine synthase-like glycosyltransferase
MSHLLEEVALNWNKWIRQIHRWLSIVFTVTVIVTFVALAQEEPVVWISYVPLAPLFLLLFTGLYLFVLPYVAKWRSKQNERKVRTS